jgi:CRISPR-associated exonuclease Cas4
MYSEEEYLMLSALQHLLFCERQCFLIHSEQEWQENYFTAAGSVMHEKADRVGLEINGPALKIERGLPLRSSSLGLSGKADVVEFHRAPDGAWVPFPIEYKHGKPKADLSDRIQLCAQALCLEEMLECRVPEGALFYGRTRRRLPIEFDLALRNETISACQRLHDLIPYGEPPAAVYERRKCEACSLKERCMPEVTGTRQKVAEYLQAMLEGND